MKQKKLEKYKKTRWIFHDCVCILNRGFGETVTNISLHSFRFSETSNI